MYVPEVLVHLCDPNHRTKAANDKNFTCACGAAAVSKALTAVDCERIKINFAYFLRVYKELTIKQMIQHSQAVVDHQFNIPTNCEEWCKWSKKHAIIPVQTTEERKR